jgi:GcrA cell cycle regulator
MSFDWNDATKKTLRALWAEGLTTAEIGRRMGIGKNAVLGKAHRLNLPSRKSPIVRDSGPDINARDQRIMEMVSQGVAQTVAASLAGVTRDVVQGVVSRARQSGRLPDRHLPPATQPPMPGDPLTDAAGRAAEALAEFGRLAAARSAGAASLQVDHQALAELRADIAIWRSSVMHELTDLRRLIERLRDDLASPAAVDAAGCQPQTEAQIEVLRGAEPAGGKAAPAGAVPPRRRFRGARNAERERLMRLLWAQPEADVSQRQIVAQLNALSGIGMTLGALQHWAMHLGLPYRNPRLAHYGRPRVARTASLLSAEELAEVNRDIASRARAQIKMPEPPAPPAPSAALAPPSSSPAPAPTVTTVKDSPPPSRFRLSEPPRVLWTVDQVAEWTKAHGFAFGGAGDMRRINILRVGRGEPPIELADPAPVPPTATPSESGAHVNA